MKPVHYLPGALGVCAVIYGVIAFWPEPKVVQPDPAEFYSSPSLPKEGVPPGDEAKAPSAVRGPQDEETESGAALPEPEYEYVETLIAVPLAGEDLPQKQVTQNDPEVKRALAAVRVELYETSWCGVCKRARAYMDANGIAYSAHDIESDANLKEKVRRLSGSTAVPVLVIDGQASSGFSEGSFQSRILEAVKKRLSAG